MNVTMKDYSFEPKLKNMWGVESIIKVKCKLNSENIIYVLNLPIVEKTNLNFTVIPKVNYLLVLSLQC